MKAFTLTKTVFTAYSTSRNFDGSQARSADMPKFATKKAT